MSDIRFIQTLYFNDSVDPLKHSFGWVSPEYHLMGWALSCLQVNKLYGAPDLYCNTNAARLLKDTIGLPYANVYITHDDMYMPHERLWALPKLHTYSLQDSPFIHLDGDVFLFDKLPLSLTQSSLIAQNVEEATDYYLSTQQELMEHFTYFPPCIRKDFWNDEPIKAVNAGILGGNDIAFIKEYTYSAFEYIRQNEKHLSEINTDRFNVFFEQHLFYALAKEKGIPVHLLLKDIIKDNQYQNLGDFHEVPCKKTYLHLLGQYKKDWYICQQMALRLKKFYPDYYDKIVSLFTTKAGSNDNNHHNEQVGNKKTKLEFLEEVIDENEFEVVSKAELRKDLKTLSKKIGRLQGKNEEGLTCEIEQRDIESVDWYCMLFCNDANLRNQIIERCKGINIVDSCFDWGGLLNAATRIGIRYYELLEFAKGEFYNLVIPEAFADGFSLHDIDEMEKIILDHLTEPVTIGELFVLMHQYVEDDILENNLAEYERLIILMLKQLVVKKAIRPYKKTDQVA